MIISKTPLRMSFAGGGSDLREYYKTGYGAVVSTSIDKYVYITANKRFSEHIRVGYSEVEFVDDVSKLKHNLVREALITNEITKSIEIVYMSDLLPNQEGSGLAGSSSIMVGTLNALHAFKGEHVSGKQLANEACEIEIERLKHPIGKQDQYAVAYGGFNYIKFNSDESVVVQPIIFNKQSKVDLNNNLLAFHTGVNTRSDTVLNEQRQNTDKNLEILGKMVQHADELRDALRRSDITEFGNILHKGWELKQKLASNMTNNQIDDYYKKATQAGAIGGKILGSGGGGFLLLYVEPEKQDNVRKALSNLKETHFGFESEGSKIIYVSD